MRSVSAIFLPDNCIWCPIVLVLKKKFKKKYIKVSLFSGRVVFVVPLLYLFSAVSFPSWTSPHLSSYRSDSKTFIIYFIFLWTLPTSTIPFLWQTETQIIFSSQCITALCTTIMTFPSLFSTANDDYHSIFLFWLTMEIELTFWEAATIIPRSCSQWVWLLMINLKKCILFRKIFSDFSSLWTSYSSPRWSQCVTFKCKCISLQFPNESIY